MKRMCLFPIMLILLIADILVKLVIKAECWIAGIAFVFLGIGIVLAVFNQMWLQLGILTFVLVSVVVIMLLSAELQVLIEYLLDIARAK